jgi:hypothetical protein
MKINVYLGIMLLFASLFVSCKKDIAYGDDFSRSEKIWNNFKASSGNSYRYKVNNSSLAGSVSETIITVKNGQVVGRSYVYKARGDSSAQLVIRDQWEENASSLGSHAGSADLVTLDEIYHRAKSDWLKKRGNAHTYFETKNNGMISLCGYVQDGCIDYCLIGISIGYIEKL